MVARRGLRPKPGQSFHTVQLLRTRGGHACGGGTITGVAVERAGHQPLVREKSRPYLTMFLVRSQAWQASVSARQRRSLVLWATSPLPVSRLVSRAGASRSHKSPPLRLHESRSIPRNRASSPAKCRNSRKMPAHSCERCATSNGIDTLPGHVLAAAACFFLLSCHSSSNCITVSAGCLI